ncbi:MAG TPA: DMT family transporter [Burkholderiales bacterium]|nr:DMT family transporter [Burkholderiales bacterium]
MTRGSAVALMLAAPVLWSSAGVVTRHIEKAQPFEQVFWRSLFAFLFVGTVLLIQKQNPLRAVRAAGVPGLVSGLMWAIMFTAFLFALSLTTTANALVVMSVSPLLTALLAKLFLKDPVPVRTLVAASAAAAGIAWMFSSDLSAHYAGMAIAFLIPVAAAINVVVLRASAAKLDLVPAVMLGGALSCLIALPFALPFSSTARDIALLAFLGITQLGLPCMLLVLASRALLAPEIALLGLLEVVLGPLWVWLGAGEVPTQSTLLGGLVVLGALVANELFNARQLSAPRSSP